MKSNRKTLFFHQIMLRPFSLMWFIIGNIILQIIMKTKLFMLIILATTCIYGCKKFDDSHLWDSINNLNDRVDRLEEMCDRMNTNISSLQSIVQALENNDAISNVSSLPNGYTITFVSGKVINIYNGTDGKDGSDGQDGSDGEDGITPVISVKQDTDGVYYWTLNGDWLIVDGQKVKAVGEDGSDGQDGTDGEDGAPGSDGTDGKDGITPQFKIEEGYWYISYDNRQTWEQVGKATGEDGIDGTNGEIFFKSVSIENGYVCFILNDTESTIIKLPFVSETELSISIAPGTLENSISDGQERTLIRLKLSGNVNDDDIKYIRYYMTNLEYLDLANTQIEYIVPYAFEGMARIKEIILPQSCNSIGDNAFENCRILQSVSVPGATVSASAITSCQNLKRLECANVNGQIDNPNLELVLMGDNSGKVSLPFASNTTETVMKVKKLVFGSTTTEITNTTNYNDKNLIDVSEIYFDPLSKISVIVNGIFTKSNSLEKVTFPISLTTLESYAFDGCSNLTEIIFPEGCVLKALKYNTKVKERSIFTGTGVTEFSYPKSIETIAGNVFYGTEIETIVFPENNNYLQLTHGTYSSYNNSYNQWTNFQIGVFENLTNLKAIKSYRTVPPVCTQSAFNGLNEQFFYNCILYVPLSAISNYKTDTYWSKFKNILPIE